MSEFARKDLNLAPFPNHSLDLRMVYNKRKWRSTFISLSNFPKKTFLPNLKNTIRFHNHTNTLSHLSDKIMLFFYMYET